MCKAISGISSTTRMVFTPFFFKRFPSAPELTGAGFDLLQDYFQVSPL
jgi:hypothetical protein